MSSYKIEVSLASVAGESVVFLRVGFGSPAQNDQLVCDASARLDELEKNGQLEGGSLVLVNGPASLPVATVLSHRLAHRYAAVGVFDPKMAEYVVACSHGGRPSGEHNPQCRGE